jgi:hypothetical protein
VTFPSHLSCSFLGFNITGKNGRGEGLYICYNEKYFIDKKMFLPSFVHLFVHYCMEEVDCFSNPELFTKKNARLPLLTIEEQKSFLINLFNM